MIGYMKNMVGILNVSKANNYGSVLQCYALQNSFDKIGIQNEIIDYISPFLIHRYKIWNVDSSSVKSWFISNFRSCLLFRKEMIRKLRFRRFRNIYLRYSEKTVFDKKDIEVYSRIICGSDQIWNTRITENDSTLFLDFGDIQTKKAAYAVSLGYTDRSRKEIDFYKKYISPFLYIGVRESMDVSFVKNCVQEYAHVEHVLDPTLLLEKKDWEIFISSKGKKEKYILAFIFQNNNDFIRAIKELSKEKKLPVYMIAQSVRRYNKENFKMISGVGPIEFLNLINKAEFVVTDSFHGTAFSIAFEKQFVSMPYKGTENRILSLLSLLGLEDRVFDGSFRCLRDIDYKNVIHLLEKERKKSIEFLETIGKGEWK